MNGQYSNIARNVMHLQYAMQYLNKKTRFKFKKDLFPICNVLCIYVHTL